MLTKDEQAFIDGMELAIDWGLPLSDELIELYHNLLKRSD